MRRDAGGREVEDEIPQTLMRLSKILTQRAIRDYRRELHRSLDAFGATAAERLRAGLVERFARIEAGTILGHRHQLLEDLPAGVRCAGVGPLLVIYDAEKRLVLAIVDGRRDVAAIVARRLDEP